MWQTLHCVVSSSITDCAHCKKRPLNSHPLANIGGNWFMLARNVCSPPLNSSSSWADTFFIGAAHCSTSDTCALVQLKVLIVRTTENNRLTNCCVTIFDAIIASSIYKMTVGAKNLQLLTNWDHRLCVCNNNSDVCIVSIDTKVMMECVPEMSNIQVRNHQFRFITKQYSITHGKDGRRKSNKLGNGFCQGRV